MLFIILLLVESDDLVDSNVLEDFNIFVWMMPVSVMGVPVFNRAHEGSELVGDDPAEVTILNSLIILILLHVECTEVVPAKSDCVLEPLKDVKQCAIVKAASFGGITVGLKD